VGGNATFSVQPPVMHFGGYELGRAVQVDSIKTRVESAYGFSACNYNIMNCINVCCQFQLAPLQLGSVHKQRFVVTNQSSSSKRLHVIVPATPYFKAKCEKRGLMAPGMSEVRPDCSLIVYRCTRTHSEDTLWPLVPFLAQPDCSLIVNQCTRTHSPKLTNPQTIARSAASCTGEEQGLFNVLSILCRGPISR